VWQTPVNTTILNTPAQYNKVDQHAFPLLLLILAQLGAELLKCAAALWTPG
jgi:hypothetical protein